MYLEDGGEWCDSDAGADEDGVLGAEDVGGGRAEGAVHVHLQRLLQSHLLPGTILKRQRVSRWKHRGCHWQININAPRQSPDHCGDPTFVDDSRGSCGAASPSPSPPPRTAPSRRSGHLRRGSELISVNTLVNIIVVDFQV